MARPRRRRSLRATTMHDRRSTDLPRNAEVAAVEIDDPLALELRAAARVGVLAAARQVAPVQRCSGDGSRSAGPEVRMSQTRSS